MLQLYNICTSCCLIENDCCQQHVLWQVAVLSATVVLLLSAVALLFGKVLTLENRVAQLTASQQMGWRR